MAMLYFIEGPHNFPLSFPSIIGLIIVSIILQVLCAYMEGVQVHSSRQYIPVFF
jgi:hypothetical protein